MNKPKTACKLIIDARERNVTRHAKELDEISFEIKQITTADYAVLSPLGNIIAVIERKSLDDFASSLKDGRHDNKKKLVDIKAKYGCRIIYIIEGPAYSGPNDCFGNIPYRYIESSIFHLMMRDGVTVIQTRDTLHTAQVMVRFVKSMDTLSEKITIEDAIGEDVPISNIFAVGGSQEQVMQDLTKRHTKTDHDAARELWSCFKGISVESADDYSRVWSIADIIQGKIPRADIINFKMSNGKKISKNVVMSLTGVNKVIEVKLLSHVEGVSTAMASDLMSERSLSSLLSYGAEGISMCKVGKTKRAFGRERAERILRLFNYKYVKISNVPTVPTVPNNPLPNNPPSSSLPIDEDYLTSFIDGLL